MDMSFIPGDIHSYDSTLRLSLYPSKSDTSSYNSSSFLQLSDHNRQRSTFVDYNGQEKSFMVYNITIKDPNQPMLISRAKRKTASPSRIPTSQC